MPMRAEALEGGAVQIFLMVGMSYADEQFCSFLKALAIEVYSSEFGYNPLRIRPWSYHSGSQIQFGNYLAVAVFRLRSKNSNAFAPS